MIPHALFLRRLRAFGPAGLRTLALAGALVSLAMPLSAQTATPPPSTERRAAAEQGDAAAQYELGLAYHTGTNVPQDYATAATWLERAAEQGHAGAQNHLARYRFEGLGGPQDRDEALRLFEAAAAQGAPAHLHDLARVLEPTKDGLPRAVALYTRAAEAGLPDAQVSLGVLYQEGRGVPRDPDKARRLYEPAAEQGHPRALNNLGLLYVRGDGVAQDYAAAAKLFAAAAERGQRTAMSNLGVLYENGFGVPLDEARAHELYRASGGGPDAAQVSAGPGFVYDPRLQPLTLSAEAEQDLRARAGAGDPVAQFQWGWALVQAPGLAQARAAQAVPHFKAAAQKGHGPAMANLGTLYAEGLGAPQDFVLGYMWLSRAADLGVTAATSQAEALTARMTAAQINDAQTRLRAMRNAP